jgi:hypothetical protein
LVVLVIQPLPFPVIELVIADAVALCASEAIWQLTVCVEPLYVQPETGTCQSRVRALGPRDDLVGGR